MLSAVNNTVVGLIYKGAAFLFFLLAGAVALIMQTQLAVPENTIVSQDLYNQLFTMHGTTMMYLFAVPAVEALGVLLLPQMLAARDLSFPRLIAFAIWAYIVVRPLAHRVSQGAIRKACHGSSPAPNQPMRTPETL